MTASRQQRGGFLLGFVVGALVALGVALAVALYVTKVPAPFINKVPQRSAEQDAAEQQRNRSWDPNAPLAPRAASGAVLAASGAASSASAPAPSRPASSAPPPAVAAPMPATKAAAAAAGASAAAPAGEPYDFYVQAGAFARAEDADQQRGRLAMLGHTAKINERAQSGRTVYRVRLGPFATREEAESVQGKLAGAGVEAALVRVDR